jgi:hypothetical protein
VIKANKGRDGKKAREAAKVAHRVAVKAAQDAFKKAKDECKKIKNNSDTPTATPTPVQ